MKLSTWPERIARIQPWTILAWTARLAGLTAVFFGGLHYLFVSATLRTRLRQVLTQTIGSLQVFSGLLNLGVSGSLKSGQPLAIFVSGLSSLYLLLFYVAVNPHFPEHDVLDDLSGLIALQGIHLVLVIAFSLLKLIGKGR